MTRFDTATHAIAANDGVPPATLRRTVMIPGALQGRDQVALRQLRHHTKNALQRLLAQVATHRGLQASAAGRSLAADLERRIMLSASLSDALFGLVRAPERLQERLAGLSGSLVELLSDGDQTIVTEVHVDDTVPDRFADLLVRIANELVGNAVKHGMHVRMVGRIHLVARREPDRVVLTVSDDGWGFGDCLSRGEGLKIAQTLGCEVGGSVRLERKPGWTVATVELPLDGTQVLA